MTVKRAECTNASRCGPNGGSQCGGARTRPTRRALVSELMPDTEVDAAAAKLALEMTETSPLGLRLTKECLSMSIDTGSLEQAVAMEDRNQVLCVRAGYIEEGARAFLEKRKPRFAPRA